MSGEQRGDFILHPALDGCLLRFGHTAVAHRSEDFALDVAQRNRCAGGLFPLDALESAILLSFLNSFLPQRYHDTIDLQGDDGSIRRNILFTPDPRKSLILDVLPKSPGCVIEPHQA